MNQGDTPYNVNTSNSIYHGLQSKIQEYVQLYGHYDTEANDYLKDHPRFPPVRDSDIWPDIDKLRVRADIQYTRNILGVYRRVSFNISASPLQSAFIIFQFDKAIEHIPELNVSNASILAPHLAKILEINQLYTLLRNRYNAVLSVLNHMKVGICICSSSGECTVAKKPFCTDIRLDISGNRYRRPFGCRTFDRRYCR